MRYEFTEDCKTGIPQIDEEHQHFFKLINEAMEVVEKGGGVELMDPLLKRLSEYAAVHFEHEEKYMREHNDPELELQIFAHLRFREALLEFDDMPLNKESVLQILDFMARWLFRHILYTDTLIGKTKSISEKPELTKEYLTGIELIDKEHKVLFDILGEVYDVMKDDTLYDKYDPIMEILGRLKEYTVKHFSDEEAYMEEKGYEGLESQRAAHEAFVDKLEESSKGDGGEFEDNQSEYLESLFEFLCQWLYNHILKMDTKIPQ
ncbi:hemerythrin [Lachnospiraceae bacterium XBB1006]|nr:hemerythrin [Lachnospiraceae bacterium XBB1006]